ncbi:hypothetical protein J6590_027792 [Homalodisca vitripennis]|nr:hypothetical protein J6590_027792 [Homalodisca vitripennis]
MTDVPPQRRQFLMSWMELRDSCHTSPSGPTAEQTVLKQGSEMGPTVKTCPISQTVNFLQALFYANELNELTTAKCVF